MGTRGNEAVHRGAAKRGHLPSLLPDAGGILVLAPHHTVDAPARAGVGHAMNDRQFPSTGVLSTAIDADCARAVDAGAVLRPAPIATTVGGRPLRMALIENAGRCPRRTHIRGSQSPPATKLWSHRAAHAAGACSCAAGILRSPDDDDATPNGTLDRGQRPPLLHRRRSSAALGAKSACSTLGAPQARNRTRSSYPTESTKTHLGHLTRSGPSC